MLSAAFSLQDLRGGYRGLFVCLMASELIFADLFDCLNLSNIGGFHFFLPSHFRALVSMELCGYAQCSTDILSGASWWLNEWVVPAHKVSMYLSLLRLNLHRLLTNFKGISLLPFANTVGYASNCCKSILLKQTYLHQNR